MNIKTIEDEKLISELCNLLGMTFTRAKVINNNDRITIKVSGNAVVLLKSKTGVWESIFKHLNKQTIDNIIYLLNMDDNKDA